MTVEVLLTSIINEEMIKIQQFEGECYVRSLAGQRAVYTVIFGIMLSLFILTDILWACIPVIIVYIIVMCRTNAVKAITKLAKKNPDMYISEIVSNELKPISQKYKNNKICVIAAPIVLVLAALIIVTPFKTKWEYKPCDGGYKLVSYVHSVTDSNKNVVIPSQYKGKDVVAIADKAFYDIDKIEKVTIPDTVTTMGSAVFKDCDNLVTVEFGKNVSVMGGACFMDCDSFTHVVLPDSLKELRGETFKGCDNLTNVSLPLNITEIRGNTFEDCSSLESITIPHGVTRIGGHAFRNCKKLNSVSVPDTLEEIGSSAFRNCSKLTEIEIPLSTFVNERAFKGSPTEIKYLNDYYSYSY